MSRRLYRASAAFVIGSVVALFSACGSSHGGSLANGGGVDASSSAADAARANDGDAQRPDGNAACPSPSARCDAGCCLPSCTVPRVPCSGGCCLPRADCSSDGWCWENPLPQGNSVRAIWARAKNDAWLVGSGGFAKHWDGRSWVVTPTGTRGAFHGVIGFAPDEVFAVATDGRQGDVFRWNGTAWSAMPRPSMAASWRAIWGTSADDLWVFGTSGNAAHAARWNGSSWSSHDLPSGARAYGAWGTNASDVRSVGDFGGGAPAINQWNGSTFASGATPSGQGLLAAWGSSNDDWWTSHNGGASHWNGRAWETHAIADSTTPWMSIWGAASSDVWSASYGGGLAHWDGSKFSVESTTQGRYLFAVAGSAADDVWAGGLGGSLLHRAGAGAPWTPIFDSITPWFSDVTGSGPTDLWAVGVSLGVGYGPPVIAHGDGTTWRMTSVPLPYAKSETATLNGVSSVSPNDAWAVGSDGLDSFALRWNGSAWTDAGALPLQQATDVWAADATHVWVVGANGKIAQGNGSSWSASTCGSQAFWAVHGSATNDVWAVGGGGAACHFDGGSWTPKVTPLSANPNLAGVLMSVFTVGPNEAWAGSGDGEVYRWNGASWSLQHSYEKHAHYAIRGIYADGSGGVVASGAIPYFQDYADGFGPAVILRRSAAGTWTTEDSGTTNFVTGMWGTGTRTWVVGAFGTVLRHD